MAIAVPRVEDRELVASLRANARPLIGERADYDQLLETIGEARIVLLGEASHGTHEFYRERARITRRLIEERGFTAVAIEGDWPDAHRVNRWVRGGEEDRDAEEALRGFARFPTWMWRNVEVADFVGRLRAHNEDLGQGEPAVGFYGLDLYSLGASMQEVISYLEQQDPRAALRARRRYECLQPYAGEGSSYGQAVLSGLGEPCRRRVVEQLVELRRNAGAYLFHDGIAAEDEYFYAEQNATVVADAEEYYRTMFGGRTESWNRRDRHMADTLDHLLAHLERHGAEAKVVVWAHNSHVGDARYGEMSRRGEQNLGQLMRERHGFAVRSVGFTTSSGTVTAASDWGTPAERKRVRAPLPGSYESTLHATGVPALLLCPLNADDGGWGLGEPRLHRAIGVVYRPQTERQSHWFVASLAGQYDALVHVDRTRAVEPLEPGGAWERAEPPETYPSGL